MIRTSLQERNARGSAAETAPSPPTRTKSSVSVVTKRTFTAPSYQTSGNHYANSGPVSAHAPMRMAPNGSCPKPSPEPRRPLGSPSDKKRRRRQGAGNDNSRQGGGPFDRKLCRPACARFFDQDRRPGLHAHASRYWGR